MRKDRQNVLIEIVKGQIYHCFSISSTDQIHIEYVRGATAQEVERLTRVSSQFRLSWDRAIALPETLFPWGQLKYRPH